MGISAARFYTRCCGYAAYCIPLIPTLQVSCCCLLKLFLHWWLILWLYCMIMMFTSKLFFAVSNSILEICLKFFCFFLKAYYSMVFLLDDKLLPVLKVWLKHFIHWLRRLSCNRKCFFDWLIGCGFNHTKCSNVNKNFNFMFKL